jgi:hypothetical protein
MLIDVFIDFSRVAVGFDIRAAIARLADAELLGAMANRVTCAAALDDVPPALPTPEAGASSRVSRRGVSRRVGGGGRRRAAAARAARRRPPHERAIGVLTEAAVRIR